MPSKEPPQFQRGLRSFARIVVVLLVLFVVFLVLIPFVGLDQLRQPIASALSQSTGLKIELESLNLEWTEGLGLRCGGLRVRSQDGSRELFSAEKMFLLAEMGPRARFFFGGQRPVFPPLRVLNRYAPGAGQFSRV